MDTIIKCCLIWLPRQRRQEHGDRRRSTKRYCSANQIMTIHVLLGLLSDTQQPAVDHMLVCADRSQKFLLSSSYRKKSVLLSSAVVPEYPYYRFVYLDQSFAKSSFYKKDGQS